MLIFTWETRLQSCQFIDHEYLINSFSSYPSISEALCLYTLFRDEDGIGAHFERITDLAARYDEVIERLRRSESIGAIPTRSDLLMSVSSLRETAECVPTEHDIYEAFAEAIEELEDLSDERQGEYLAQFEQLLATSLFPATARLADYVEALAERAPEDGGVWRHEGGCEFYQFRIRLYATSLLSSDEIHQLGLREVERLRQEIFDTARSLDFTETESLPELFDEVAAREGTLSDEDALAYCQDLVDDMQGRLSDAFNQLPERELVLEIGDRSIGFYSAGRATYTVPSGANKPRHELPTTTYHEGLPGHHLQMTLEQEMDLPRCRRVMRSGGYGEGWATYAERLAWDLGAYENDPLGNLGRLQYELMRAARLVVDTGLHAQQWSSEQAFEYMWENTGLDEQKLRDEIARYLAVPGQAVSYWIGLYTILAARDRAMQALGERFSLAEFHDCILGAGVIPLPFIDDVVDVYIEQKLAEL